jgi:hypothetical protein
MGPPPEVFDAINRLKRTELSPLEEAMFKAWAAANQIEDPDGEGQGPLDLRVIYQQTGGRVLPPGQLLNHMEKTGAIDTLMRAQEQHDQTSPMSVAADSGVDINSLSSSLDMGGGDPGLTN